MTTTIVADTIMIIMGIGQSFRSQFSASNDPITKLSPFSAHFGSTEVIIQRKYGNKIGENDTFNSAEKPTPTTLTHTASSPSLYLIIIYDHLAFIHRLYIILLWCSSAASSPSPVRGWREI